MLHSDLTPLVVGIVFLATTAARSLWLRRARGINAYVIDHGDPLHRFLAYVFFAIVAGLLVYFGAAAVFPEFERNAGLVDRFANDAARWFGLIAMVAATVWTGYAQISMGDSWRIGVPKGETLTLRTRGPFAVSRNPIFLGMLVFVLGMTMWSPSAVTLALLAVTYVALEVQIRVEEAYLERTHGETYRAFRNRVRRWI